MRWLKCMAIMRVDVHVRALRGSPADPTCLLPVQQCATGGAHRHMPQTQRVPIKRPHLKKSC